MNKSAIAIFRQKGSVSPIARHRPGAHRMRMFGWFKKRSQADPHSTEPFEAVERLGELMERYPLHVLDVSFLPVPKLQMKTALKEVWRVADPTQRRAMEVGYVHLANFQSGVGRTPISLALPDDLSQMDESSAWIKKTSEAAKVLLNEFEAFKQASK